MKFMLTGVLLLAVALTTGCWDTITTMSPGETIELDEMTIGDEYVIDSCQITRTAPDGVVPISASSLSIFSESRQDKNQARQKYLFRTARVTGLVTEVTDYRSIVSDTIEITVDTVDEKTVRCVLNTEFTAAQLNGMLGKTATLEGTIEELYSTSVWLYDCSIVPPR